MYLITIIAILATLILLPPLLNTVLSVASLLMLAALFSTLMVATIIGSWFSFILFLIYITGILVLFGYILAISSNVYTIKSNYLKSFFILTFAAIIMNPTNTKITQKSVNRRFELTVTKLFEGLNIVIYWNMALVLLAALIIVVAICYNSPKPLRAFI